MPKHRIIEGFLGAELRDALLETALANEGAFEAATTYKDGKETVHAGQRRARKYGQSLGELGARIKAKVEAAAPGLADAFGMSAFPVARIELELVASNDGDGFGAHIDTLTGRSRLATGDLGTARAISAVYYLYREPKAFSGGQLRFHPFGGGTGTVEDVEPRQDMLVAFPSFMPHEVLEVSCPSRAFADSRFSVNAWIHKAL